MPADMKVEWLLDRESNNATNNSRKKLQDNFHSI